MSVFILILVSSVLALADDILTISPYSVELSQRYDGDFNYRIADQDGYLMSVSIISQSEVANLIPEIQKQGIEPQIIVSNVASITDNTLLVQEPVQVAITKAQTNNQLIAKPVLTTASNTQKITISTSTNNNKQSTASISKSSNSITGSAVQNVPSGNWNFIVGIIALLSLTIFVVVKKRIYLQTL